MWMGRPRYHRPEIMPSTDGEPVAARGRLVVSQTDHCGLSVEWRCGMASAAVFLARPADEGVPEWYVEEAERSDGTPVAARARQVVSQTDH